VEAAVVVVVLCSILASLRRHTRHHRPMNQMNLGMRLAELLTVCVEAAAAQQVRRPRALEPSAPWLSLYQPLWLRLSLYQPLRLRRRRPALQKLSPLRSVPLRQHASLPRHVVLPQHGLL
jgi:hypothetical protein